ncbi:LacI family DNA-binding transcriptional regulator [Alteribacillus sp. YIM 98480]|uniref:LacI family DNA-binding transcriptional regulator n=1 Tax=Alteribacillus sp. YIM 98480 TaxID=2606599 RepID=UPI00131DE80F|nr:LacI family DNA-binding transcriptional regulator [Alteribacillus sp. YIM 98480]
MTTIKDVAKHAQVSVATVSRVLNNNGYVNEDTKKKVVRSIEELNYKPNAVARSLFKKESKTIGLIIPDIMNPFFPELARVVEDVMNKRGYTVILCNSDANPEKEAHYLDVLKRKYVDGVMIVTNTLQQDHIKEWELPLVGLDRPLEHTVPSVYSDNVHGACLAVSYLKEIGCQHIAHIQGPLTIANAKQRYQGYKQEIEKNGSFQEELVVPGEYQWQTAEAATISLLKKHPYVDGIFAGNDVMAFGVMKAAIKTGRNIPEDLQLIGFDNIFMSEMMHPSLTTISQPIDEMGKKASELLLSLIKGNVTVEYPKPFKATLKKRSSTLQV